MFELAQLKAPPGPPLYDAMVANFDYSPVLRTAVKECNVSDVEEAKDLLDAFLQWIAAMPGKEPGQTFVMLKCDVDRIFHSFVLNTRLYREFCDTFLAHFVDHTPIEERGSRPAVEYTIQFLRETYGRNLHPKLAEWADVVDADAWEVSCGKC